MEWDVSLETGIPIVDDQHMSLFRQVDDLLDPTKADRVPETLNFLGNYVLEHFGTEEIMQKISHYPFAEEHKELHDAFTAALVKLKAEYEESGNNMVILMKLTKTALDWLEFHIKGADKEFGDYFKTSRFAKAATAAAAARPSPEPALT